MADYVPPDEVTGDEMTDVSLEDMGRSLFQVTKQMRSVCQVAGRITLWDTTSAGQARPATMAKHGHHPLIRILIQGARDYEKLERLEIEAAMEGDMANRIQLAKAKGKALSDLRDSSTQIQKLAIECVKSAQTALAQLASLRQSYQMHRERLGKDLDFADTAELEKIAGPDSPAVSAGPRRLESFLSNP